MLNDIIYFKNTMESKKLDSIKVRYFPPGLILEFKDREGGLENKSIDLLNLSEK